jgi:hypothetical protein
VRPLADRQHHASTTRPTEFSHFRFGRVELHFSIRQSLGERAPLTFPVQLAYGPLVGSACTSRSRQIRSSAVSACRTQRRVASSLALAAGLLRANLDVQLSRREPVVTLLASTFAATPPRRSTVPSGVSPQRAVSSSNQSRAIRRLDSLSHYLATFPPVITPPRWTLLPSLEPVCDLSVHNKLVGNNNKQTGAISGSSEPVPLCVPCVPACLLCLPPPTATLPLSQFIIFIGSARILGKTGIVLDLRARASLGRPKL